MCVYIYIYIHIYIYIYIYIYIQIISAVFFMLSIVKSFEIFFKHNGYGFMSESFALNCYIFTELTNKKLLLFFKAFFSGLCKINSIFSFCFLCSII